MSIALSFGLILFADAGDYVTHIASHNAVVCVEQSTINPAPNPPSPDCVCNDVLPEDAEGQCDICCTTTLDGMNDFVCKAICANGVTPATRETYEEEARQILAKFRSMQNTGSIEVQKYMAAETDGPTLPPLIIDSAGGEEEYEEMESGLEEKLLTDKLKASKPTIPEDCYTSPDDIFPIVSPEDKVTELDKDAARELSRLNDQKIQNVKA